MKKCFLALLPVLALIFSQCKKDSMSGITAQKPAETTGKSFPLIEPANAKPVTFTFENGKTMTLYQRDTSYILEGDIVLTPRQVEIIKLKNAANARAYILPVTSHWRLGRIPFVINSGFSTADRNTILNAMADWESVTAVTFVPRTTDGNYIEFMPSTENNSAIGMSGGRQVINLVVGQNGVDFTSAEHEIGHALGMFHEQARTDRDNFIRINWNNIRSDKRHNFQTYTERGFSGVSPGAFDFNSIMLYSSFITDLNFVFDPAVPVMQRLDGSTWTRNFFLSTGDVETIRTLYGPPFARIRQVNVVYVYDTDLDYTEIHSEDDVFVHLYADEACTIPYTTPVDLNVTFTYYESTSAATYTILQTRTIPAGQHALLLYPSLVTIHYMQEHGNIRWDERRSATAGSGFFR